MPYSIRQKARFYSQLQVAMKAGIPLELALAAKTLPGNKNDAVSGLSENIRSGKALSRVLAESKLVSPWEVKMLAIGEEAGAITEALSNLALFFTTKDAQFRTLKSKLVAPFMLILAVIVISPLPQIAEGTLGVFTYLFRVGVQLIIVFMVYDLLIRTPFQKTAAGGFNPVVIGSLGFVGEKRLTRRVFEVAYLDMLTLCLQCGLDVLQTLRLFENSLPGKTLKQKHRHAIRDVERDGKSLVHVLFYNRILCNREIKGFMQTAEESGTLHSDLRVYVLRKKEEVARDVNFRITQISRVVYTVAVVMGVGSILG